MSNNTNSSALPPPTTQGRFGSPSEDALRTMNQKNGLDAARANSVGGSKKKKTVRWKSKTNSGIMLTSKGDFSLDFVLPHAWY